MTNAPRRGAHVIDFRDWQLDRRQRTRSPAPKQHHLAVALANNLRYRYELDQIEPGSGAPFPEPPRGLTPANSATLLWRRK